MSQGDRDSRSPQPDQMSRLRLDDLYRMIAYIYGEQNALRPVSATFAHFVEVCGMLSILDRKKKREGIDLIDALCKALGWYFPLMAKLRVRSVEEIIYRKYPFACPYCRLCPHQDLMCKTTKGASSTVDHKALRKRYEANRSRRPSTLDEWQGMFQQIYPRAPDDKARSTLGLFEELGELAEAVRVYDRYPKYFVGEAADVFSYLMGIANELTVRQAVEGETPFSLEEEFLKRYPGLCIQCGFRVCICPSVPRSTVGRMSKELDIGGREELFADTNDDFQASGRVVSLAVLERVGGYPKLAERFPLDRGDTNRALISLCLRLATVVEGSKPDLAERFHSVAVHLSSAITEAGSPDNRTASTQLHSLAEVVREVWRELEANSPDKLSALRADSLEFRLGTTLAKVRVLFVHSSPKDEEHLRIATELRAIRESIRIGRKEGVIEMDDLPAATVDDLRRALLTKEYEILHFSGHANPNVLVLESEDGTAVDVSLSSLAELVKTHSTIRCVILNACESLAELSTSIAAYTIGMEAPIGDEAAIEFSRGFYDAFAAGKTIDRAVEEGRNAAILKGRTPPLKVLRSDPSL